MRTTAELIDELKAEASPSLVAALVIASDHDTEFVFNTDENPFDKLSGLLMTGGVPIGMFTEVRVGTDYVCELRPLREFAEEMWVRDYLVDLCLMFKLGSDSTGASTGGNQ